MSCDLPPSTSRAGRCDEGRSAFFDVGAHLRLWSVAAGALALDLWSKHWAFEVLSPGDVRQAIPSVLVFRRSINPGALFGMGSGLVSLFIVASFVALGFVFYMFICSSPKRRSLHLALSFILAGSLGNLYDRAFIMADKVTFKPTAINSTDPLYGKIVNLDAESDYIHLGQGPDGDPPIRRIPRKDILKISQAGVVRDFLKIVPQIAGYDIWPWVFNVADSLLVAGVSILVLNMWFDQTRRRREPDHAAVTPQKT